jgi:hypothetical protein
LGDRIPGPAPDRYAVVIVGGCQLIGGAVDRRRNLITSNGDAVNSDPTQPSEIVEFTKSGKFVAEFNVDAAPDGAFGVGPMRATSSTGCAKLSLTWPRSCRNIAVCRSPI